MGHTVNLVATRDAILQYFPTFPEPRPGTRQDILSADFPINAENCQTELGRWLATHISTTRFDDDASACRVLLPVTELGLRVRDLSAQLMRHQELSAEKAETFFRELELWIANQRETLKVLGASQSAYRTTDFEWPVFGSAKAKGAVTPEVYFDECARQIRMTGGVILRVGLRDARPPETLLRTMAKGEGLALLARYSKTDPFGWKKRSQSALDS